MEVCNPDQESVQIGFAIWIGFAVQIEFCSMDQESVQIGFTVQLAILIDWICSMNQVCGTDWICGTNRVCGTDRVVTVQTGLRERTQSQVFSPKVHRGGSVVVFLLL